MLLKVRFLLGFTVLRIGKDMWPTYVEDDGRDILKYHRALAQQTTMSRYKHDIFEGIMLHLGVFC